MKQWTEIYNKYKDTELMKKFVDWWDNRGGEEFLWAWDGDKDRFGEENSILDIWGYLICFAETKGITIDKGLVAKKVGKNKWGQHEWKMLASDNKIKSREKDMLWCADKFFEVAK